jgi:hypothetical protein
MKEMVVAVFEAGAMAEAAVQDLAVARIPSAAIRRSASGWEAAYPMVTVVVDDIHATAVTGILNQYGPVHIEAR